MSNGPSRSPLRAVLGVFLAERRRLLLTGALLAATTVLAGIGLLGLSGWFISAAGLAGLVLTTAWSFDVFVPGAGVRLLALGRTASRYGERLVTHDATLAVLAAARERLLRGWARPQAARMLLARPARLLFRLTADLDALDALYLRLLVPGLAAIAAALMVGLAIGWGVDPWLGAAVAAVLLGAGLGLPLWLARRARRASRLRAHAIEALRARVIDLVAGQTTLVMAGRLSAQRQAVAAADARQAAADDELNRLDLRVGFGLGLVGSGLLALTLAGAAWAAARGQAGAPVAAMAVLMVLGAMEPFAALRRGALEFGRCAVAARRLAPRLVEDVADADAGQAIGPVTGAAPETGVAADASAAGAPPVAAGACAEADASGAAEAPGPGAAAAPLPPPLVGAERASIAHPGGPVPTVPTLRDLSFEIRPGERVALVGPSGSGKSTLLAAVAGDLAPCAGQLRAVPAAWLTQHTELFQDSLRDNLRLADERADDARLRDALLRAGLLADLDTLPAGPTGALDTPLGEGGLGLSGGQARRLALARLLLRPSTLWLLDEPTEGLDAATAAEVMAGLARERRAGWLLATHLRREARWADRLLVLREGRIGADLARGTPAFDAALETLRPD